MAFGSVVESAFLTVGADYNFIKASGGNAAEIVLNPRETATLRFNIDTAGATDDLEIEVLQGHRTSSGNGLAGASAANNVQLNASDGFTTDGDMNGFFITMTSGGEQGEGKLITDSVASNNAVTLASALSGTPSASETYDLFRLAGVAWRRVDSAAGSDDNQHNAGVTVDAANGQYVLVRARATGSTDGHRVQMSHQVDGVNL